MVLAPRPPRRQQIGLENSDFLARRGRCQGPLAQGARFPQLDLQWREGATGAYA